MFPRSFRSSSSFQHYCRVCNTQLNSCKQVRIHIAGKKHEKRYNYLKYCIDSSEYNNKALGAICDCDVD